MDGLLLENILLCDPVSKRGREAMTRVEGVLKKTLTLKDFYEQIYAHPFFTEFKEAGSDFGVFLSNYDDFSFTITGTDIKNLNDKMERFESLFNELASDELLFIRASAGSGKSIYLNYLKRERRKKYYKNYVDIDFINDKINDAYEINFDLEKASDYIKAGKLQFPFKEYRCIKNNSLILNSQWNFYIMILKSIFLNSLDVIQDNKINKADMKTNFMKVYGIDYTDETKEMFDYIISTTYDINEEKVIKETLLKKIASACFEDTSDTIFNTKKALEVLFRFLTIISNTKNPNQYLITFDNIEHLINNKKRIYDEDISKIVKTISDFIENESKYYEEKGLNFAKYFKIILVIRDTTEKMLYGDVQDNFIREDRAINIAGWFLLEEIYKNKLAYFNLDKKLDSVKFIDLISNDSLGSPKNNLMNQISVMYNHNNRRTTRILTRISSLFDQININNFMKKESITYEMFSTMWEWPQKNHIKYLCRQSVLRLIYNIISNTYYFDKLFLNVYKYGTPQNTFTRRILTWLSNNNSHNTNYYYNFTEILNEIIKSPDLDSYEFCNDTMKDFCNVLINLDECRFSYENDLLKSKTEPGPNCWCQLIIIKHNEVIHESQLSPSILAEQIKKQYEYNAEKRYVDGIRLTEAGYFLANKIYDFEFLSCLYSGFTYPLIFMIEKERILKTLKYVFNAAKRIIDLTLKFEAQFFLNDFNLSYERQYHLKKVSNNNNQMYQSVPFRIIEQHVEFLKAYKLYISDDDLHATMKIFNFNDRQHICNEVQTYIDKYKKIHDRILDDEYQLPNGRNIKDYVMFK